MTTLKSDREIVAMRRQLVLDTLKQHPWLSSRAISETVYEGMGSLPSWAGGLWLAPWIVYQDLIWHEERGHVERRAFSSRNILWAAK